ncbi:TolC family protein [Joostella sp.]|uniref:TolC family protein n=1 Tax=Joostella sp. TaxID=2231138 RepID=UPI003A94078E
MRYTFIIGASLLIMTKVSGQDLNAYIEEAIDNNPEIQSFDLRYQIAEEKINEVNNVQNTEFSAGYFVSEPETRTGPQRAKLSVKQMLPWFGTVGKREDYAAAMADSEYVEMVIAKRKLALSVSNLYYILYGIRAKQNVLDDNYNLLKTYEQLALTATEVGKASAVDVLRLQIRQNEVQQEKEVLMQKSKGIQAALNNLLNRNYDEEILAVSDLEIPDEDPILGYDALSLNPELLKYDKLYESVTQSEKLNQKESAPNIGFGLDYIAVSERTDVDLSDNGKDVVMPMVSLSIPIFNKKYKSISKQNELRQQEIKSQKDSKLNVLQSTFSKAISQRNEARIKFNLQKKNLKQAKYAEDILIKNYENGTIDFNDVLDIQELQLKFGINQIEAIQEYYTESALINYLID